MMSMNLINTAILKNHGVDYHCIITKISKTKAINLLQKADLNKKSGTLNIIKHKKNIFTHKNW